MYEHCTASISTSMSRCKRCRIKPEFITHESVARLCYDFISHGLLFYCIVSYTIQGGSKSKPQPNDQKVVLNRIKTCE